MKIGIHKNQDSFSERWIDYCESNNIDFKLVDCYRNDIISQLDDCDALMWHYMHKNARDTKFAKQLLFAVEASGKKVFPDYNTMWHFDDKVAQKYLFEGINAPQAESFVFYNRKDAIQWAVNTTYPKVFKLRNGSGSENVRLVHSKNKAVQLINKAFRRGFKHYEGWSNLKERVRKYRKGKTTLWNVFKGIIRLFYTTKYARMTGREKGYILFQEFIQDNDSDIRIIVVGGKAFGIKRMIRDKDFRASGSGFVLYEKEHFTDETVKLSFEMAEKIKSQCAAFDFVYIDGRPLVIEISYGFVKEVYDPCTGYWDKDLHWYPGKFDPYGWMVDNLISSIEK